jgi:hypothetical protein
MNDDDWQAPTDAEAEVYCVCCLAPILPGKDDEGRCPVCAAIEKETGESHCTYN